MKIRDRASPFYSLSPCHPLSGWLLSFWWVILFTILCYAMYEASLRSRSAHFTSLSEQFASLQLEKKQALILQKELMEQNNSQSDPAWIELILMKELGLVPEGQKKVFFTK